MSMAERPSPIVVEVEKRKRKESPLKSMAECPNPVVVEVEKETEKTKSTLCVLSGAMCQTMQCSSVKCAACPAGQ
jgi:hypothetical protein